MYWRMRDYGVKLSYDHKRLPQQSNTVFTDNRLLIKYSEKAALENNITTK